MKPYATRFLPEESLMLNSQFQEIKNQFLKSGLKLEKKPLCKMKPFCVQKQNKWHLIRGYKTRSQAGQTLHSNYFRPPFAIISLLLLFQCWLIGVLVQHKLKYGLDKNSSIQQQQNKKVTTTKNLAFNITSIMV